MHEMKSKLTTIRSGGSSGLATRHSKKCMAVPKKQISEHTNPDHLRTIIDNARRRNQPQYARQAIRRLAEITEIGSGSLQVEFWRIIEAYEEILRWRIGRRKGATRVRNMVRRFRIRRTLTIWVKTRKWQSGFAILVELDLLELTGEHLIVRFAKRFDAETVRKAKARLDEARHWISAHPDGSGELEKWFSAA